MIERARAMLFAKGFLLVAMGLWLFITYSLPQSVLVVTLSVVGLAGLVFPLVLVVIGASAIVTSYKKLWLGMRITAVLSGVVFGLLAGVAGVYLISAPTVPLFGGLSLLSLWVIVEMNHEQRRASRGKG